MVAGEVVAVGPDKVVPERPEDVVAGGSGEVVAGISFGG